MVHGHESHLVLDDRCMSLKMSSIPVESSSECPSGLFPLSNSLQESLTALPFSLDTKHNTFELFEVADPGINRLSPAGQTQPAAYFWK